LANRTYFASFVSDRCDEFFDHFDRVVQPVAREAGERHLHLPRADQ
jgi:hypothetical protein